MLSHLGVGFLNHNKECTQHLQAGNGGRDEYSKQSQERHGDE